MDSVTKKQLADTIERVLRIGRAGALPSVNQHCATVAGMIVAIGIIYGDEVSRDFQRAVETYLDETRKERT